MALCPLCGEPLTRSGEYNICTTGCTAYIDSDDLSMDEVLESMEYTEDDDCDDIPF